MTPLKLINTTADGSEVGTLCRLSQALLDLTARAKAARTTAVLTRSSELIERLEAVISEAKSAASTVDTAAVWASVQASLRPARSEEIKRQLQILIGSFPNASKQDLSIFGVALTEDVASEQPAIAALTNACRHLRRKVNFVPTIAEVLAALGRETERLRAQVADVKEFDPRLREAEECAANVRTDVAEKFERSVQLCIGRLRNSDDVRWISNEVCAEAQRRIDATAVDDATAEANRKRLKSFLTVQPAPKKDTGWAK